MRSSSFHVLVLVQLPFADARPFVADARKLRIPPWPQAEPYSEFVRAVGQVRKRRRGGVYPWLGEDVYCDARRALRIKATGQEGRHGLCRFRRYLSDGGALSRIEVGIMLPSSPRGFTSALDQVLSLLFTVPGPDGSIVGDLLEVRPALARHLLRSTTPCRHEPFWGEDWWLQPVQPLVIAECRDESLLVPAGSQRVPVAEEHGISLHTYEVSTGKTDLRVWLLHADGNADQGVLRTLRVHLLLLHAERMALRHILRQLSIGRLVTDRDTDEFERLQRYLLRAFHGLARKRRNGLRQHVIFDVAYQADDLVSDDMRNTIGAQLQEARLNIRRVVEQRLAREALTSQLDLVELGAQLELLRQELSTRQLTAYQQGRALEVAHAAEAAKRGDGPGALQHLARTGRWSLDVAKEVGMDVVSQVLAKILLGA